MLKWTSIAADLTRGACSDTADDRGALKAPRTAPAKELDWVTTYVNQTVTCTMANLEPRRFSIQDRQFVLPEGKTHVALINGTMLESTRFREIFLRLDLLITSDFEKQFLALARAVHQQDSEVEYNLTDLEIRVAEVYGLGCALRSPEYDRALSKLRRLLQTAEDETPTLLLKFHPDCQAVIRNAVRIVRDDDGNYTYQILNPLRAIPKRQCPE
ncbi:MAG: hypothetical protein DCC75_05250 [Proteobacteria bacterium]|nr:MAG: hypothetical protein DCC75_05250 [Pseudomonadota bacterium]